MTPREECRNVELEGADARNSLPQPTVSEVGACQFSSWYSLFRNMDVATIRNNTTNKKTRKNITIESIVIRPLPAEFVEYLSSDGVRLPECATEVSSCMNTNGGDDGGDGYDDGWDGSSEEGDAEDDDGSDDEEPRKYSFPDLTAKIRSALAALGGGGCMPKLNWSSPKDAAWMNCGSLKCTKAGDVYLLLKSSDFVGFDLEGAWGGLAGDDQDGAGGRDGGAADDAGDPSVDAPPRAATAASEDDGTDDGATGDGVVENPSPRTAGGGSNKPPDFEYELVLRKWCNLHPSMEFRCFVYEHDLVAVSQRNPTKFYPHLQIPTEGSIHPFATIVHSFFQTYVQRRFAGGDVGRYVVDLYLDSQERVWIVDFNVWGERTDGLLFDWDELAALGGARARGDAARRADDDDDDPPGSTPMPETRVVTKDMKSMTYDPLSSYRGPTDVMDLLKGDTGKFDDGNASSFDNFMKQCVRPSEM